MGVHSGGGIRAQRKAAKAGFGTFQNLKGKRVSRAKARGAARKVKGAKRK